MGLFSSKDQKFGHYTAVLHKATYDKSYAYCNSIGGKLAPIRSLGELHRLAASLRTKEEKFWRIGLYFNNGQGHWSDGQIYAEGKGNVVVHNCITGETDCPSVVLSTEAEQLFKIPRENKLPSLCVDGDALYDDQVDQKARALGPKLEPDSGAKPNPSFYFLLGILFTIGLIVALKMTLYHYRKRRSNGMDHRFEGFSLNGQLPLSQLDNSALKAGPEAYSEISTAKTGQCCSELFAARARHALLKRVALAARGRE